MARQDRWILAGMIAVVCVVVVAVSLTIVAGREGVARSDALTVSMADLVKRLNRSEPIQFVDARSASAFAAGHVRTAINLPADELVDPEFGATQPWPQLVERVRMAGIDPRAPTVVYADDAADAAFVLWVLLSTGSQRVQVLEGGLDTWVRADGRLVTADDPRFPGEAANRSVAVGADSSVENADETAWSEVAPPAEFAIDLTELSMLDGTPVRMADVRTDRTAQIALAGATTHHLAPEALIDESGIRRSRVALRKALAPLGAAETIVYGDNVKEAALAWWVLASSGRKARVFTDGFLLWEGSGLPTEPVESTGSGPAPTRRVGGGCG